MGTCCGETLKICTELPQKANILLNLIVLIM